MIKKHNNKRCGLNAVLHDFDGYFYKQCWIYNRVFNDAYLASVAGLLAGPTVEGNIVLKCRDVTMPRTGVYSGKACRDDSMQLNV